jgi:predicted metalloprotease with PDZ domain
LISESRYFELLGDRISLHRSRPGRNVASVEEASFLAWIKHYQPTPDSRNRVPNYYVKGSLIGLVFDLELNRVTDGNSSLDDLMKIIFEVSENEGLTDSVIKRVLSRITGESMEDLYRMIVEEHEEINFNHFLEPFGLRLENVNDSKVDDEEKNFMSKGLKGPGKEGWLGIATSNSSGTPVVQTIFSDSPAYFSSLCNGDEIIAVDGIKVTYETFKGIMKRFKAGDKIEIVIFRDGLLHSVNVTLGENRIDKYKIVPVETPDSEKAEGLRNSWLYRGIKSS